MPATIAPAKFRGPFTPAALGDHRRVIADLDATGFSREALIKIGVMGSNPVPALTALRDHGHAPDGPLATMVRLFMLAEPIAEPDLRRLLGGAVDPLVATGLLEREGDRLRAHACLLPQHGLWTLRDFNERETGRPIPADHVPSVSLSTALVANFTVRNRAKLGLDLGCGSGYQALRLAAHCDRVIATDINERCLNFAEMSMAINGIANVELRHGSLFEPLEGLRFDAIASNPPFVISPASELIFRDSGLPGDQVSERIIRRFAEILDEGGWATILFNWHHPADDTWADKPRQWIDGKSCDGWLIRMRTDHPEDYAKAWILSGQGGSGTPDPAKVEEWTAYYRSIGAEAISLAALIVHKRRGATPNWFRVDLPPSPDEITPASDQIRRIFANETLLRAARPSELLDLKLRLTPAARLEQTLESKDGRWSVASAWIVLADGFKQTLGLAAPVADHIAGYTGERTPRELAGQAAASWGVTPDRAEAAVAPVLTRLLRDGFLEIVR